MSEKIKLWWYKHFHLRDDYSVRVTKCDEIRENYYTFATPWLIRAIIKYICLNLRYPVCTIVFTHHRYY